MIKKWEKTGSESLHNYRVFTTRQDRRISPRTGHEHTFYIIESNDWVNIVPITADGKVIMIRQFRHGLEDITLEVPGGIVDEGEDPLDSAVRELLEETGYAGDEVVKTGFVAPNPALFNNTCHSYLAKNVRLVAEPHFDGSEDISIEEIDLADVPRLIRAGKIIHALTVNAFYFLDLYQRSQQSDT